MAPHSWGVWREEGRGWRGGGRGERREAGDGHLHQTLAQPGPEGGEETVSE